VKGDFPAAEELALRAEEVGLEAPLEELLPEPFDWFPLPELPLSLDWESESSSSAEL